LPQFKMAVNLSGRDLESPDLVEQVARILKLTGFPAGQLELELTEGVAINESSGAQATLEALRSLGVHLAIDDFGTGYSALSRVRDLTSSGWRSSRRESRRTPRPTTSVSEGVTSPRASFSTARWARPKWPCC
jgi:EAL domain-containing protein (putative c-di-GMP-specific phosphodiesterase class I)